VEPGAAREELREDVETPVRVSGSNATDTTMSLGTTQHSFSLQVNDVKRTLVADPRISLLDALRDHFGLTGTKRGCNQGACGACTVLVDGERINSCLTFAIQYEGRNITTVEGLASSDNLHPVQKAFIEHDGFQCGFCTPGQICSAVAMLSEYRSGMPSSATKNGAPAELTADELRERMSGNLCRCGAYVGIREAIRDAYEVTRR
jgi:xanthine dehydrogenase YagT iron-sulfur-binding subunit